MGKTSREFQVFVKPAGPRCNLGCDYCYYLGREDLYPRHRSLRMTGDILEAYIVQHMDAFPGPVINFSWHGGEPTLLGPDFFRKVVALQQKHRPPDKRVTNGIQTNGTLLDENWCRFLAQAGFGVGLSLDGPRDLHDRYRVSKNRNPTHALAMRGFHLLQQHHIPVDLLCVVHAGNVGHPGRVYHFFKEIGGRYLTFLPLVEVQSGAGVSQRSITPGQWGAFLCSIFDEWVRTDIGQVEVQIFDEMAGSACGREHALCIFRETCGDIPIVEHNGDVFACDHFADRAHYLGNIRETRLADMIESPAMKAFGRAKSDTLPRYCQQCGVLDLCNGGCPKDRFVKTPDGQGGLNYLCAGYKSFFNHCRPFIRELSAQSRQLPREGQPPPHPEPAATSPKIGRNSPCPCGSGRKYKKCCLGQ